LVHGANASSKGAFTIAISTDIPRKENDFCASAIPMGEGNQVSFDFTGSSAGPDLPICTDDGLVLVNADTAEYPYGLWYSLVGTGLTIQVVLMFDLDSPVIMNIYSGSTCGAIGCVEYMGHLELYRMVELLHSVYPKHPRQRLLCICINQLFGIPL
jgi:hypothetical protein